MLEIQSVSQARMQFARRWVFRAMTAYGLMVVSILVALVSYESVAQWAGVAAHVAERQFTVFVEYVGPVWIDASVVMALLWLWWVALEFEVPQQGGVRDQS